MFNKEIRTNFNLSPVSGPDVIHIAIIMITFRQFPSSVLGLHSTAFGSKRPSCMNDPHGVSVFVRPMFRLVVQKVKVSSLIGDYHTDR